MTSRGGGGGDQPGEGHATSQINPAPTKETKGPDLVGCRNIGTHGS